MHSWTNPFADKREKVAWPSRAIPPDNCSEDEDSCPDQVVYYEDHLNSLLSLYNRPDKNERQGAPQPKPLESENGLQRQESSSFLPSARETAVWAALEGADVFCQGAARFTQYETEGDWSTGAPEAAFEGGVSNNYEDQDQREDIAMEKLSTAGNVVASLPDAETYLEPRDSWDHVLQADEKLGDIHSYHPDKSATGTRISSFSKHRKGTYKKKLRFNYRSASKASCLQGPSVEPTYRNQNVSLAQQLQSLAQSDSSYSCEVNRASRTVESKSVAMHKCVPIAERLRELAQQDAPIARPQEKFLKGRKIVMKQAVAISDHKKMFTNCKTVANEEIVESSNNSDNSDVRDSYASVATPIVENPPAQTMNERFQEALLAAPERNEDFHTREKMKGSVFGFTARLQRVLEQEKMERVQFVKALQIGQNLQDDANCLKVQIVTKNLEARLAVCICKVLKTPKVNRTGESGYSMVTVVFNMRTNAYLELEVGGVVRIHPPWREVSCGIEFSRTIICTYFCEVLVTS